MGQTEHLPDIISEGRLAHEHEVDAAAGGPKIDALVVHLTAIKNLGRPVDMSANSWSEHLQVGHAFFV